MTEQLHTNEYDWVPMNDSIFCEKVERLPKGEGWVARIVAVPSPPQLSCDPGFYPWQPQPQFAVGDLVLIDLHMHVSQIIGGKEILIVRAHRVRAIAR